jgi:hypothetical protein
MDETWLSDVPETDAMPIPHRRVEVDVLRGMLTAVRKYRAIEVLYQSMNPTRPAPTWRWITPHAFGNDGMRWHVRAYCHIDAKFKDFLPNYLDDKAGFWDYSLDTRQAGAIHDRSKCVKYPAASGILV